LCSCPRGAACTSKAKHPRTPHGVADATTDGHAITSWWRRWPQAGIGIATGATSGLVVVDVDPRHDGIASLRRLQAEHGPLPRTATVRTGGGGGHIYLRLPAGRSVRSRCPLAGYPGVDLKADGGYVVAPPSLHASGRRYEWHRRERIAEAPGWLLDLAAREEPRPDLTPRRVGGDLRDLTDALRRCPRIRARFERDADGLRDTSASGVDMSLATGLALVGLDADAITHAVVESRTRAGLPMKSRSYIRSTVAKALEVRA
jgi:hypothetical protein